ncbi:hypothetical protein Tco_1204499 [Tanacetum coccineum]
MIGGGDVHSNQGTRSLDSELVMNGWLFSSLPGVLTPVRGESLKILNGFDVSLPVSHLLWSSQSFGHQKAINGFDMPLPVAVCSGLVNPLAPRKDYLNRISDNGTEFKNRVMNEFCEKKGIKREFSVARTPQQNGVAERRNMTLIEAARTMLADSKLPTTFWAEAVNTSCYVENRVIIVKPHNKTPYELFKGRTPALSFMRPFGCHVTILNTLDHLGKFDGKSDDGFFVGYSLTSKAFRVYNIRTRKVEENLHIRFLENKPIVTGDGPKWLFDIDSLTKSMNYVPVVAGTNSNDFAGSEESNGAGHTSKETEFSQDYIVMPLWKDGSMFDSSSKNSSDDEPQPSSNAEKKDDEGVSKASGFSDQEQPESSTPNINTVGPSINTASANFKTGSLNINTVSPTVITTRSNRSQNVSDMFSLGTTYLVPSTPNTRIHKDHSLDHVIGDVHSGVQTRRMTKTTNEQGFISAVYEGKTHEDLHTCLFACFLSQEEPKRIAKALSDSAWVEAMQEELLQFKLQKVWVLVDLPKGKRAIGTKWVFRNKKDERGIVIQNKARLVAQGHTQEEGIDYDDVFAPVARIKAIRLFLAYASFMGFMVYQMDVKSAFLYGRIEEEVYVCQPPGFEDPDYPDKVYKVVKVLYGLQSSTTSLYRNLGKYLLDMGFTEGKKDQTLVYQDQKGIFLDVQGLQVKQKEDGIFISQDKYVADMLGNRLQYKMETPKKRISTGKDGIVRILSLVATAEIQAVEKERKAKNILLMAIPKEHIRRFHGKDDAKEIWEAIRT